MNMNPNKNRNAVLLWAALSLVVLWLAILMASAYLPGMNFMDWLDSLTVCLEQPFSLTWTEHTPTFILVGLLLYAVGLASYYAEYGNRRPGEEYGSATWGNARTICAHYEDKKYPENNIIFTENVRVGMDTRKHRRNLNTLIIGGSGSGKTRFYAKPNIMQSNCSYIITDPKGELLRSVGGLLEEKGYDVKVLNLIDLEKSNCFNPFCYIRTDQEALKLVTNLIESTTPQGSKSSDPFWDRAETALTTSLILYLIKEALPEERNFATVMYMLENATTKEEDENYKSPVDILFEALEEREGAEHIAVKQYKVFKQAAGKTAKSILVSAAVRMACFNLPEVARITSQDEMDFGSLGERKRAIFCVIPDSDNSLDFLVSMLYTLAFQELYHSADFKHGGRLPVHVRLIMDEFANVALPGGQGGLGFQKILSTCRSREISCNIIIQNIAQLKLLFKDSWENLPGNCDFLLYLGGNEQSTFEYLSKLLGKQNLDTRTYGMSRGRNGSSSVNYQQAGRELLSADEIRMLDNQYALLFIRGEKPIIDKKYDLMKHPNIALSEDGGSPPYLEQQTNATTIYRDLPYPITKEVTILEMEEVNLE